MAEVVVVFLILGVLSAIAIPKFGGSGGSRAAAEVEISGRAELGGLVSEVVAAPDVEALGRYLRYKSTQLPAGAFKALDALIKEGSCFVVSWAERPNLARSLAVDVSFPAAAPYYPMRLTSAYGRRKVALDLRVSGWQAPAAAVTGQPSARVGYYQDPGAGHRRFTRVLFKDRAQTLAEDWTFKPRRFAPRLTLAAFFAAYPLPGIVMLFALAGLTSAFLVGLTAFPDWRGPSGLPPLSALGLSQLVPFFGPAFVLRRLRPEPAAWPLKTRAAFWSLAPLFVAATLVLCRSLDGLWSDPRSTTSVIFRGLIQMSNEGATKGNLGAIRSASSIYIGDHGGAAPPDLSVLLKNGKYLGQLPLAKTPPHHPDSAAVRNMTGEQYAEEDFSDAGGWAYVFTGPSSGTVVVNCTHLDSRGKVWISY